MKTIPYGRQSVNEEDIAAVCEVLKSDWLTTGPKIAEFENAVAAFVGSRHAVAVSSGTAALHAAMFALGIGPGDEVIVPPITFVATANSIAYQGGTPVFADVDPETLLIDPDKVESKITRRTKAIIAVDYAGHPCDYDTLKRIADSNGLYLVADACHALGAQYEGRRVGTLADLTVFSFHPVKHITTGEGGAITSDNPELAQHMRIFRNHGLTTDHHQRDQQGSWFYEMVDLGYNYRITDFQCALGLSQIRKLPEWIQRRQEIAGRYDRAFDSSPALRPLALRPGVTHAYHLYVIRLRLEASGISRSEAFETLRAKGIGVNVHYIPVHLHPFYQNRFGTKVGQCPVAEQAYEEILSLPVYPGLTDTDQDLTIDAIMDLLK